MFFCVCLCARVRVFLFKFQSTMQKKMHEICDYCGQAIDLTVTTSAMICCEVCKIVPYCSETCRIADAANKHHRKDRTGTCLDPTDQNMWKFLRQELGLKQDMRLPTLDSVPFLVWPGPISDPIPHAMRHTDAQAIVTLAHLTKVTNNNGVGTKPTPYYLITMRDLPRVWFRQLTSAQRGEIRALLIAQLTVQANQSKNVEH